MQRRTFLIGGTLALCGGTNFAAAMDRAERRSANALITNTRSKQVGISAVLRASVRAGFSTGEQLLAVLAIGIAESSLRSTARKWHPEYGYRPATDTIGVSGPAEVWKDGHQINSDRGLWQISSHWWPQYTDAECDNVARAARIVFDLSKSGRDFQLWDPFKAGTAQKHFDTSFDGWPALRPLVDKVLARGIA